MTTPDNISICRLTNTGHLSIVVNFSLGPKSGLSVTLPGGSSTDLYTIPVGTPGNVLAFTAQAEGGTLYNIQLFYQAEATGNQFYFTEILPGQAATPKPAISATTPGKNIALSLVCDGVVVVGTGDL